MQINKKVHGITYGIFAVFFFSLTGLIIKYIGKNATLYQIVFFHGLYGLTAFKLIRRKWKIQFLSKNNPGIDFLRVFFAVMGLLFFTYALKFLKLSIISVIFFMVPQFIMLFSKLILKTKLQKNVIITICTGFIGCLIFLNPTFLQFNIMFLSVFLATILNALSVVLNNKLIIENNNKSDLIESYYIFSILVFGVLTFNDDIINIMNLKTQILFFFLGLAHALAYYLCLRSIGKIGAIKYSILEYSRLCWAFFFDLIIWYKTPTYAEWVGILIIVISNLIFFKNLKKGKKEI